MIICFQNISENKNFDRIYLCTHLDISSAFIEISKIGLEELTDDDGFDGNIVKDPFLLNHIYAN